MGGREHWWTGRIKQFWEDKLMGGGIQTNLGGNIGGR